MDLTLAIIGLVASFFFAGTEAAFTSFNKIRLDAWKKSRKRLVKPTLYFTQQPEDFFSTILIGNNFASILYSTFATVWLIRYLDETLAWALLTLLVVYFGEIFPKTVFRSLADFLVLQTLMLVYWIYFLLKPLIYILNRFVDLFLKWLGVEHQPVRDYFSRDELHLLLHAGSATQHEQKYISNVLHFKDVKVKEAMIPRPDVVHLDVSAGLDVVLDKFMETDLGFMVICDGSMDNIRGVIFAYELLHSQKIFRK